MQQQGSFSRPSSADIDHLSVHRSDYEASNANSTPMHTPRTYNYEDLIKAQHEADEGEVTEEQHLAVMKEIRDLEKPEVWLLPIAAIYYTIRNIFSSYSIGCGKGAQDKREGQVWTGHGLPSHSTMLSASFIGLFNGVLLGFIAYILFVLEISRQTSLSTYLSAYLMLISVYGLAFSPAFRTVCLLAVPYIAAVRLRLLVLIYASSKTLVGPVFNFLRNASNFRSSVACFMLQLNTNLYQVQRLSTSPYSIFTGKFVHFISDLNGLVNRYKDAMKKLNEDFYKTSTILFDRDMMLDSLEASCQSRLVPCETIVTVNEDFHKYQDLNKKLKNQFKAVTDFLGPGNLTMTGAFDDYGNITGASDAAFATMMRDKMSAFIVATENATVIMGWFVLLWTLMTMLQIIVQAMTYRRRWLLEYDFDNDYLTPEFVHQEKRAVLQGLVPTVPLVRKERKKYKKLSSLAWTKKEKGKALRSMILLALWMMTLIFVLVSDYAMFYLVQAITPLFDINLKGGQSGSEATPSESRKQQKIIGDSAMANVARSFKSLINPMKDVALDIDTKACKPAANEPNLRTNLFIIGALSFTVFSIIFEVYILRLRHLIMAAYYPNRATQRAAWLRMHIRNNRGLFHRLVHKYRTLEVRPGRTAPETTWFGRKLQSKPNLRRLCALFNITRENCSFCGEEGNPGSPTFKEGFIRCLECGAYYCRICQVDLEHICMHCRTPMFAISVEVDLEEPSSDEEFETMCSKYFKRTEKSATVVLAKGQEAAPTLSMTRHPL